jgi:hypothetical protein
MADRSTLRKPVAFGTLAIAALIALGNWCYWKPHFWQLAVFPGISFLILQWLAFRRRTSPRVFLWADYVYYALIGGAIVLGSQFLRNADLVSYLDGQLEAVTLTRQIANLDGEISLLKQSQATAPKPPDEEIERCLAENMRLSARRPLKESSVREIDLCQGLFYSSQQAAMVPIKITNAENDRAVAVARLKVLGSIAAPSTIARSIALDDLINQFIWYPMFVLIGISIKLGKTTAGLFAIRPA